MDSNAMAIPFPPAQEVGLGQRQQFALNFVKMGMGEGCEIYAHRLNLKGAELTEALKSLRAKLLAKAKERYGL